MDDFSEKVKNAFRSKTKPAEAQDARDNVISGNVAYITKSIREAVLRYATEHCRSDGQFVYQAYIIFRTDLIVYPLNNDSCEPKYVVEEKQTQKNHLGLETERISTVITRDGQVLEQRLSECLTPDGFQVSPWCMVLLSWSQEYETMFDRAGGPFSLLEENHTRQKVKVIKGPFSLTGEALQVFKPTLKKEYAKGLGLYSGSGIRIYQNQLLINKTCVDVWKGPRKRFIPAIMVRYLV